MNKFSKRSLAKLETCHEDLQRLFNEVIKRQDCTVLSGTRDEETQNKLFDEGRSKLRYPKSKHNSFPSAAVDVVFYPIDWNDIPKHIDFMNLVKRIAEEMDIDIQAGGDWKHFKDYVHYERKK